MTSLQKQGPLSAPFAVISDIHGNIPALDAVLAAIEKKSIRDIFALGDHVWGGPAPLQCWRRLESAGVRLLRGPSEIGLAQWRPNETPNAPEGAAFSTNSFSETQAALGELICRQAGTLPDKLRLPMASGAEVVLSHGSLVDPLTEIDPNCTDDELRDAVDDDVANAIITSGAHLSFRRKLEEGALVIGAGSVGAAPGGNHAHYVIVEPHLERMDIFQETVDYEGSSVSFRART